MWLWRKLQYLTPQDCSGCMLQESCGRNRGCHVLKVDNAWLPYEENKLMHFENEASVLDFRSGICLLFRGQNMRSHHSLWVIFLICKEK